MVELVKVEKNDLEELTDIAIESFLEDKNKYGNFPPLIDIDNHKLRYIDKGYAYNIVHNGKVIGGTCIFSNGNDNYTLGSIFIHPSSQNKGIGQEVISLIEANFPNAKKWTLDTPYKSFRNHHFYEKMGYVKIGEEFPDKSSDFRLFLYEKIM
ncbi:hypothetical protein SH1V18_01050 [Vallitalea longa]|uniref:N-acetyltransferase domain-containing protein n=1 Tax=Vallitalea longa TaxID=2936439 RepID=A0A9W5Y721_9FIRM|nr:GNAT family N-acetyltransferase [Vallitalea longa]GKX27625.1 hypothetical protein SH1V18_01050 [Vallitalea longa]